MDERREQAWALREHVKLRNEMASGITIGPEYEHHFEGVTSDLRAY